jgi:SRSO17 transposase
MSTVLNHPTARALLRDATLSATDVAGCRARLSGFLKRYLPLFYRTEQRKLATVVIRGHLSGLARKTCEPIARQAHRPRKPVQHFVGAGRWDDEAVMDQIRCHVGEELADDEGVLVLDTSGFAKKGNHSCGVQRQWCGRLGKNENCQVGVFLIYATGPTYAPLARRLYLPREWTGNRKRRQACHVPKGLRFREKWRIGLDHVRASAQLSHGWVAADDEFGRVSAFRGRLRRWHERYVVDVPANTLVRDRAEPAPVRPRGAPPTKAPFRRAEQWVARQPPGRWQRIVVGPGAQGPQVVDVLEATVRTKGARGRIGDEERLVVIRTVEADPPIRYALSNAGPEVPIEAVVRAHAQRHRVEELFAAGKGEVGLGQYEVRSWVGWHHHMTLSLLALWFVVRQRRRLGGKKAGADRGADPGTVHAPAAPSGAERAADRHGDQSGVAA